MEQNFKSGLEELKTNELLALILVDKHLTQAKVKDLAEFLKHNQSLTWLNLSGNVGCHAATGEG